MRVRTSDKNDEGIIDYRGNSVLARPSDDIEWQIAPDFPNDPNIQNRFTADEPMVLFNTISLIEHVRAAADRDGAKIAIDDGDTQISRSELILQVDRLADRIASVTKSGEVVGLLLPNSVGLHVAILACLASGRPYVPLDLTSPPYRNQIILEQSGLTTIVTDGRRFDPGILLERAMHQIDLSALPPMPQARWDGRLSTDELALILYTSGSTGLPKGVANSERAILERVRHYIYSGGFTSEDIFLPLSSACTVAGTRECFTALALGATLVLTNPERIGLRGIRAKIREHGVTVLNGVPAILRALMNAEGHDNRDFNSIKLIKVGGDRILSSDINLFRSVCGETCRIQAGYSSTETPATYWEIPLHFDADIKNVPAGYLHSSVAYRIVTEGGRNVESGEEGELVLKSPYIALGFWQGGQLTPGHIETDNADPAQRIFYTGDLVRQLPSGLIDLIGRKDRQIKINGKRVEPTELEVALRQTLGISDAAVIAVPEVETTHLVAFVSLTNALMSDSAWKDVVLKSLRDRLPSMLQPTRIHSVIHIPRLPSGKQDTVSLLAIDASLVQEANTRTLDESLDSGVLAKAVSRAWRAVLGSDAYHLDRSFAESGGDSLSRLRLVFHLEVDLNRSFLLSAFELQMRPSDVAKVLEQIKDARLMDVSPVNQPTVYLFSGLTGDSPSLAALRNDLMTVANVLLVPYPDWRAMVRGKNSIADIAETALAAITDQDAHEPLHFIGYSLGGAVAFQAAAHWLKQGGQIASLTILDTQFEPLNLPASTLFSRLTHMLNKRSADRLSLSEKFIEQAGVIAARPIFASCLKRLARINFSRLPPLWRFSLRNALWEALQIRAIRQWRADPLTPKLPINATLFVSEEDRPGMSGDLGWSKRVAAVSVHRVRGDHHNMIRAPRRAELCAQIENLLGESFQIQTPPRV